MKSSFKEYYDEDAFIEINIDEHLATILKKVNSFLDTVKTSHPEEIDRIIDTLKEKFSNFPVIPYSDNTKFSVLNAYSELQEKIVNAIWELMSIPSDMLIEKKDTKINVKDYLRSKLFISFKLVKSLETIMSHDDAIDYFQAYID